MGKVGIFTICAFLFYEVSGYATPPFPQTETSLLISAVRNDGVSEIIRLTGEPDDWMRDYENGRLNLNSVTGTNPYQTAFRSLAVSYDDSVLFWSNPAQNDIEWMYHIRRGKVDISDVHLTTSGSVRGIAYDWKNNNLYWTDSDHHVIMIAAMYDIVKGFTGSIYKTVVVAGIRRPWDIVLDPVAGYLFYTDIDDGAIHRAHLDGQDPTVFYMDPAHPKPRLLTLDTDNNILYWIDIDTNSIMQCNYSQSLGHRITVVTKLVDVRETSGPVELGGLAIYKDYIFTTGHSNNLVGGIIYIIKRFGNPSVRRIKIDSPPIVNKFHDLMISAPRTQSPDACASSTKCEKIGVCRTSQTYPSLRCLCEQRNCTRFEAKSDGTTARPFMRTTTNPYRRTSPWWWWKPTTRNPFAATKRTTPWWWVPTVHYTATPYPFPVKTGGPIPQYPPPSSPILLISAQLKNGDYTVIRIEGEPSYYLNRFANGYSIMYDNVYATQPKNTGFKALATHYDNAIVYFANPRQGDVEWMPHFNNDEVAISNIHQAGSNNVNGLASDWMSHTLYWTDSDNKRISIAAVPNPNLAQGQAPYHKVIISDNLDKPFGIAVDPFAGRIYWTDSDQATVNSAALDGTDRKVLHQGKHNERPTSIVVDVEKEQIYWVDVNLMAIVKMNLANGQNTVKHFYDVYSNNMHIELRGLTLYKGWLFFTGSAEHITGCYLYALDTSDVHHNYKITITEAKENPVVDFFDVAYLGPHPKATDDKVCDVKKTPECQHICVGYQNADTKACLCADGYVLGNSGFCTRIFGPTRAPAMTTSRPFINNDSGNNKVTGGKSQSATDTSSVNVTAIIIAVAVIVGLIVIIAMIICFCMRNRKQRTPPPVTYTVPPAVQVMNAQPGIANPSYGAAEPPPYDAIGAVGGGVGGISPYDSPYDNLAFVQDDKKLKEVNVYDNDTDEPPELPPKQSV